MRAAILAATALGLAACGPMPVERAERICLERARLAQQPRGQVEVGASTGGGARFEGEINVSSDFLRGRDPSAVFDACVHKNSGRFPTRPLYSRTDWKG